MFSCWRQVSDGDQNNLGRPDILGSLNIGWKVMRCQPEDPT